ncbi:MAG: cytidine deaminase [Marinifilaceae bacterium]|jgi:cytidine deaminase|nr:cytidine deaminase [Marinifilaceae bacterium]
MKYKHKLSIEYCQFDNLNDLPIKIQNLRINCIQQLSNSYSPYSNFEVAAAIELQDGEIIKSSNQENIAYPSGLCAERVGLFYAKSKNPNSSINRIGIISGIDSIVNEELCFPCGACLQVLYETERRQDKDIEVWIFARNKSLQLASVKCLLPFGFDNKI